jgi:hypothetical protein
MAHAALVQAPEAPAAVAAREGAMRGYAVIDAIARDAKLALHALSRHRWRLFPGVANSLRAGRLFDARDRQGAPHVAIVNETLVQRMWGGG